MGGGRGVPPVQGLAVVGAVGRVVAHDEFAVGVPARHELVELEGELSEDIDLDADAGALLVHPTRIIAVGPLSASLPDALFWIPLIAVANVLRLSTLPEADLGTTLGSIVMVAAALLFVFVLGVRPADQPAPGGEGTTRHTRGMAKACLTNRTGGRTA